MNSKDNVKSIKRTTVIAKDFSPNELERKYLELGFAFNSKGGKHEAEESMSLAPVSFLPQVEYTVTSLI